MSGTRAFALTLLVFHATACVTDEDATDADTDASTPTSATSNAPDTAGPGSTGPGSTGAQTGEETGADEESSGGPETTGTVSDEDFYEFTIVGAGLDRDLSRSFATEEAWGNVETVSVDEGERDRLYLAFPFGSSNIALNLIASEAGTYQLPQDIPVYPDILDVSFIEGSELMSFRSTDVSLTLTTLESNVDPEARTHAGIPMDGFANVEGTFSGTFEEVKANPGDTTPKLVIEASGSFRSSENF